MTAEPLQIRERRSGRIARQLPVQVAGSDIRGKDFIIDTQTLVLSRFGAKIVLPRDLASEQEITISCAATRKEIGARVVALFSKLPEGYTYGIEFLLSDGNFWNVTFPVGPGSLSEKGSADAVSAPQASLQDPAGSSGAAVAGDQAQSDPQRRHRRRNYAVRLLCSEGSEEEWIFLQDREEPLNRILETSWDFVCPNHGSQSSLPLEATETLLGGRPVLRSRPQDAVAEPRGKSGKSVPRREPRRLQRLRVWVRGVDPDGQPFLQSAYSVDVSKRGGRLNGLGFLALPGTVIEVKRQFRTALFRVVWVGQAGTQEADQIGITALQPDKNLWNLS